LWGKVTAGRKAEEKGESKKNSVRVELVWAEGTTRVVTSSKIPTVWGNRVGAGESGGRRRDDSREKKTSSYFGTAESVGQTGSEK